MRTLLTVVLGLSCLALSCSSDPAQPAPSQAEQTPAQIDAAPAIGPTSGITVSDAVPTMAELLDLGLTPTEAECFTQTIDPDGTGRVANADLFAEALGCL